MQKKTLIFEIKQGTSKKGIIFYYLHCEEIGKDVYLTTQDVKILKLLKILNQD